MLPLARTQPQRRREVAAEIDIHHVIDAIAAGDVAHPRGDVLGAVVDDVQPRRRRGRVRPSPRS